MTERIVPGPSLTAVASPVDRFVAPVRKEVGEDPLLSLARTLERVNPAIQGVIQNRYAEYAAEETAKGELMADQVDASAALRANKDNWKALIASERERDKANGTNNADKLAAASPHFRRGMMKAKAQRLALGLNDYLQQAYTQDPSIRESDDMNAITQWISERTAEYSDKVGVNQIDPLLLAEVYTPMVSLAQESVASFHSNHRLERAQDEYADELSANAGMLMSLGGTGASSVQDFIGRLAQRESGGNYGAVNTLGYTGLLQFGQARLDDFNRAHGTNYTLAQFKDDPALQDKVNVWHINDIDAAILRGGYLAQGYSLDGLRAVAHLGGIGGMQEFVKSGGAHSPSDAYGTSLSDYYAKFSGPTPDLQAMLDEATDNLMDPRKANETVVNSVITAALEAKDPNMLSVLDHLTTGVGPLGNIGWVKEARLLAEEQILDMQYQEEQRDFQRQERERAVAEREISVAATREILANPDADLSAYQEAALKSGNPDLVRGIIGLQNTVLDNIYNVRTNHEAYVDLRYRIWSTKDPAQKAALASEILSGTGSLWGKSDAESLMDALEQSERNADMFDDDLVQQSLRTLGDNVKARFGGEGLFGEKIGAEPEVATAQTEFYDEMADWMEKNPQASRQDVRKAARQIVRDMLASEDWAAPIESDMSEKPPVGTNPGQFNREQAAVSGVDAEVDPSAVTAPEGAAPTKPTVVQPDEATKALLKTEAGATVLMLLAQQAGMSLSEYSKAIGLIE